MKNFTILIALLISANVISQQNNVWSVYDGTDIIPRLEIPSNESEYYTYKGSPYFEKDFVESIAVNDKGQSEKVLVRYNLVSDALHIKKDKASNEVLEMPIARDVVFKVNDYQYKVTAEGDNIPGSTNYYAEFYNDDNLHLIGIPGLNLIEGNIEGHQNDYYKNGKFEVRMDYYISLDNGKYELLDLKGSSKKKYAKTLAMVDFLDKNKNITEAEINNFLE
ncbi:hypothetical protein [Christiangramia sp. SM2212]|uniref:DUF3857 domain-containing protein n=1 Tax=Christiangramia sediminicola TaxID=3073267 RepID=A0ABU1EQ00_9FLAO|nr:hypothetical protein [Christiangramia sp. SM2212]MDR5590463.1 hypothetical protein [Christiangramia sp. SM2212]